MNLERRLSKLEAEAASNVAPVLQWDLSSLTDGELRTLEHLAAKQPPLSADDLATIERLLRNCPVKR
ncbi:MAG: hypothetical protein HY675_12810 [Chloroflexi bacterium]|nr:hypothetical protein [Chloroflexota bacterium]